MSSPRDQGFTLIEIIVVIAVIAILASLVGPAVFRHVTDARSTAARAQLESLAMALDSYRLDTGDYPTTAQGLRALMAAPAEEGPVRWRGPYLRRAVEQDPWGRPYEYQYPAGSGTDRYLLRSLGRDGVPGGTGEDRDLDVWDAPVP